jgi:hypothetical protein
MLKNRFFFIACKIYLRNRRMIEKNTVDYKNKAQILYSKIKKEKHFRTIEDKD